MIEAAEQILLDLGFAEMRVRCHGKLARIEVAESVIEKLRSRSCAGRSWKL